MSKATNSIEINGQRYDAQTGKPFDGPDHVSQKARNLDGVIGRKAASMTAAPAHRPKVAVPIKPLSNTKLMDMKAPKHRPARSAAKPAAPHSTQTSHTLMRHVVQRPGKSLKRQHPAHGHTDALIAKPAAAITAKHSVHAVSADRLKRAAGAAKNAKISRFGHQTLAPRPVAAPTVTSQSTSKPSQPLANKPLDIFEQALQRATSHQQPAVVHHKHPRRAKFLSKRSTSISATALSVLLLVGFIGFQNRTNLSLRMAASKAGFNATLPGYKPSGFSVGVLNYSPGNVAINFHSNSDQRSFAISEKPSSWDSATLRDNTVAAADSHYQTVSVGGRTVYVYGNNNAMWVNGGVLYQLSTEGSLSAKQISQLAASL